MFYRDDRLLRNRIEDLALLKPIIEGDLSTIEKIKVDGKDQWLLFPAKLYCGQSLLDSRRESIIIDYFFTDEIPGYRQKPDFLAGRNGLAVRDEIRMVRPGFYLGRAYVGKVFLLNFTLYNKAIAERDGPGFAQTARSPRTAGRARRRARSSRPSDAMACAGGDAGSADRDRVLGRSSRAVAGGGAAPPCADVGGRPRARRGRFCRPRAGRCSTSR